MNHVLLDTQLLLWAAAGDSRLPPAVISRLGDQGTQPLFSAASIWEVVIKSGLGRADFEVDTCSLGQISHALYEVGGEYRRNM